MTSDVRTKAVALFADVIVKLAAKHPASGALRELVKAETLELLKQLEEADRGAK